MIPRALCCLAVVTGCAVCPGVAQEAAERTGWQASAGGGLRYGAPAGTMGDYLGPARGLGATMRAVRAGSALRFAGDVEVLNFAQRTVTRPYAGSGPDIDITSSAEVLLLGAGPELGFGAGRFDFAVQAGLGGAYVHAAGQTSGLGTSPQNERGNTFTTFTWQVQGGVALGYRLGSGTRAPRAALAGRVVQAGTTDFLREYNLPIGVISGLYPNPTPYAPRFVVLALTVTAAI